MNVWDPFLLPFARFLWQTTGLHFPVSLRWGVSLWRSSGQWNMTRMDVGPSEVWPVKTAQGYPHPVSLAEYRELQKAKGRWGNMKPRWVPWMTAWGDYPHCCLPPSDPQWVEIWVMNKPLLHWAIQMWGTVCFPVNITNTMTLKGFLESGIPRIFLCFTDF